jgi:hypothetical protein
MKYITTIIRKIFPKELSKPIGRWRIEHCNIQLNSKIDLSNEDHCGACGEYALIKIKSKTNQTNNIHLDKYMDKDIDKYMDKYMDKDK